MPTLKQKGKIPVQEAKTPESPKQKSKFTRVLKEKEAEPEVIKLKKVAVKPPEPEKEVVTHTAEVTRHCDQELTVHGLHDREDREIIMLGRTERVFTAEEQTVSLAHFEEAERVIIEQKAEKEGWKRLPKSQKEQEPEEPSVDKKKITKLPKTDKQQESVELKPFEKPEKSEEEPQKIKLKKVPTKPKEPEKAHKAAVMQHHGTELSVHALHDRDDQEIITPWRTERVFKAQEEASELGLKEKPESLVAEDEKTKWARTLKVPKDEESQPDFAKKKIKKLPTGQEEPETVTLKPFQKPEKAEAAVPPKPAKENEATKDTELTPIKRCEMPQRDQPTAVVRHRNDEETPSLSATATPAVSEDQEEVPQRQKVEPTAADKLRTQPKIISSPDEEQEQVTLKPFAKAPKDEEKPTKAAEEEKKKPVDTKALSRTPRDQTPKELKEQELRKVEKTATPKKESEKPQKEEEPVIPSKKPTPPGKKEAATQKEPQNEIPSKKPSPPGKKEVTPLKEPDTMKKGVELKKSPSQRVGKEKVEEEKALPKAVDQLKRVELKKTELQKELEQVPVEKKPSVEKVKKSPKTVSPKDSIEAVSLKKVLKKPTPEEETAAQPGKIPLSKEVSPGAVQMKKVPTQPLEEVFEKEGEVMEGEEEEEAWGWELVPTEDWEGEGVDGMLETPGMPGGKRGEAKAEKLSS